MKTVTDLKRLCIDYQFKLFENSWFKNLPVFQQEWRRVGRVQTNSFTLMTDKTGDGNETESWIDFPKASEMQLIKIGENHYTLIIKRNCGADKPPHIMIYELRKYRNISI